MSQGKILAYSKGKDKAPISTFYPSYLVVVLESEQPRHSFGKHLLAKVPNSTPRTPCRISGAYLGTPHRSVAHWAVLRRSPFLPFTHCYAFDLGTFWLEALPGNPPSCFCWFKVWSPWLPTIQENGIAGIDLALFMSTNYFGGYPPLQIYHHHCDMFGGAMGKAFSETTSVSENF